MTEQDSFPVAMNPGSDVPAAHAFAAPPPPRSRRVRIASWPASDPNPYYRLFYAALEPYGIELVSGVRVSDEWLLKVREEIDVLHFHWPEYVWRSSRPGPFRGARSVAGFWSFLGLARRLGVRIVWTVHNLKPHEPVWLDGIGFTLLGRASDLLIAHSESVALQLRRRFHANVVTMPMGNYDGVYPAPRSRPEVVRTLGLSAGRPVLALVGALRPYKGVEEAVEAVAELEGDVQLVIAGRPTGGFDIEALLERARRASWLSVVPRAVTDQEFADIMSACSSVLLPYRRITGSSVLLAAWTLARTAITSNESYFAEMLSVHRGAIAITNTRSASAFAKAIREHLAVPEVERWAAARAAADTYNWPTCVDGVAQALLFMAQWNTPTARHVGASVRTNRFTDS